MKATGPAYLVTKHGYPGASAWELHKASIIHLYGERRLRLEDVVHIMHNVHGFIATPAMYKTRLRKWQVFRNRRRQPFTGQCGGPSQSGLDRRIRRKIPQVVDDPVTNGALGTSWHDRAMMGEQTHLPDPIWGDAMFAAASDGRQHSTGRLGSGTVDGRKLDGPADNLVIQTTLNGCVNSAQAREGETQAQQVSRSTDQPGEAFADRIRVGGTSADRSSGDRSPIDGHLDKAGVRHWLTDAVDAHADESWIIIPPSDICKSLTTPTDPRDFVAVCIRYCSLWSSKRYKEADASGNQAAELFSRLLRQPHKHALTALNTVLAMSLLYGRWHEAIDLMSRAKVAAEKVLLTLKHPVFQIIEYLMLQAAGNFTSMWPSQLEEAYTDLCETLSPQHPYSLLAGYLYAWRVAADCTDDITLLKSIRLLQKLQLTADASLGTSYPLSVTILRTKARVQQSLELFPDAAITMGEAIIRTGSRYPANHPYMLDTKARYAAILFAIRRDSEAEEEWVASTLGRVELFGKEHRKSQETITAVKELYATTEQHARWASFQNRVDIANERFLSRSPKTPEIMTGKLDDLR